MESAEVLSFFVNFRLDSNRRCRSMSDLDRSIQKLYLLPAAVFEGLFNFNSKQTTAITLAKT
jgi:hypothetical protein